MKKQLCVAGLALAMAGASLSSFAAQTGKVTITGKVTDNTCALDPGSNDIKVDLPNIDKSQLKEAQSSGGMELFVVKVKDCSPSSTGGASVVSLAFVKDDNIDEDGNLKNGGTADKVAVQLLDKDQNVINVQTDTLQNQIDRGTQIGNGGDLALVYNARYFSKEGGAVAGSVNALANFQMVYQ